MAPEPEMLQALPRKFVNISRQEYSRWMDICCKLVPTTSRCGKARQCETPVLSASDYYSEPKYYMQLDKGAPEWKVLTQRSKTFAIRIDTTDHHQAESFGAKSKREALGESHVHCRVSRMFEHIVIDEVILPGPLYTKKHTKM